MLYNSDIRKSPVTYSVVHLLKKINCKHKNFISPFFEFKNKDFESK